MEIEQPIHSGKLARNSIFNLLGQVLPLLLGFLCIPYVVRGYGPNGFGILSIAWMLLGTFSMLDLGLGRATTKCVAECLHPEKIHRLPGLIWTSIAMQTAFGLVGAGLIAGFVPLLVHRVFTMPSDWLEEAQRSLFYLSAVVPVLLLANGLRGVLEAAQRFDIANCIKIPTSFSFYLIALIGVFLRWHVSTVILISIVARLASAGAFLFFCLQTFPNLRREWRLSSEELPALFSFGGWVMISNIAAPIFGYFERFLIASVLSVGVLTYYAVPFELISKVVIVPSSIATTLFPFFSRHGEQNRHIVSDITSRTLKYLLLIMTPFTATFLFFSHDILRLWMGTGFADESAGVMQVLAIAFFFNAFAYIPYTTVQALGRPHLKAILDLAGLPLYFGYCWLLLRGIGIEGAAIAKALSTGIDCIVLFWFASKLKSFTVRDWLSGPLVRSCIVSIALFPLIFAIKSIPASFTAQAILLAFALAGYLMTFWITSIGAEDRRTILRLPRTLFATRTAPVPLD